MKKIIRFLRDSVSSLMNNIVVGIVVLAVLVPGHFRISETHARVVLEEAMPFTTDNYRIRDARISFDDDMFELFVVAVTDIRRIPLDMHIRITGGLDWKRDDARLYVDPSNVDIEDYRVNGRSLKTEGNDTFRASILTEMGVIADNNEFAIDGALSRIEARIEAVLEQGLSESWIFEAETESQKAVLRRHIENIRIQDGAMYIDLQRADEAIASGYGKTLTEIRAIDDKP